MSTTTALDPTRTETITGMVREYEAFATLVASLTDTEWATPTRCDGFDVRDVAGHVIGLAEDVVAGRPGTRTPEEEAASIRNDTPAVAAGRLTTALAGLAPLLAALEDDAVWNGPSGVPDVTMAEGVLTLWYDAYVHADDIRAALGRDPETGPGERAALAYLQNALTRQGYGPIRIEVTDRDLEPLAIGDVDPSTTTHRVRAHEFILAATGRLAAGAVGLDPAVNIYAES
jgi:uncharacterized protein (TIGR03083 family)